MNKSDICKYSYIDGDRVIETEKGKFFITPRCNNKSDMFRYLEQKDFPFFLPMENSDREPYEVYSYVEDDMNFDDKAIDLVHILSLLHIKTTTYQEVVMDSVKELYEGISAEIESLEKYYHELQDEMETHVYMAPDEYLFLRNISILYENLHRSREYLESWYQLKKDATRERVVFLHMQPSLATFIDRKTPYFVHWDLSRKGYVVYDFLYFYKKDYIAVEMESLFQIYQSKYRFTRDEEYLFFCLVLLDEKITFDLGCYENIIFIQKKFFYAFKAREFVLKQNHENEETNQTKFDQ